MTKILYGVDEEDELFESDSNMNDEDIEFIQKNVSIREYDIVYDYLSNEQYNLGDTTNLNREYYKDTIEGICEINEEFLIRYEYEIYGKLPPADEEVVITEYAYEMYQEFEYKKTDGTVTPIETMDDLLNKTLGTYSICSSTPLKVVGIIDTKFNYERYEIAKFDEEFGCEYNVEINQIMAYIIFYILEKVLLID